MTFRYLLRRAEPFFVFYLMVETVLRLALLAAAWGQVEPRPWPVLRALMIGTAFDFAVFLYFLPVIALLSWAIPKRSHGGRTDRILSGVLCFLLAFGWMFGAVAEWLFWDEFSSRFNFIAVDYLVYTREVVGNIRESYSIKPMIVAVTMIAGGFGWWAARYMRRFLGIAPAATARFSVFIGTLFLCGLSWIVVKSDDAERDANRYLNEVAKNGTFEIFSAFWNNELKYDRFYVTGDSKTLLARLRSEIGGPDAPFVDDTLTRRIAPSGTEHHHNIVLITVESLSASYMTMFGSTDNVTPHLDRLAKESLFFPNLYATGTRTVYGLSAVTLSIPPVPGNSIVRRPQNGGLFSLGAVLNRKGYLSKFIYGGYGYFDNMNTFFAGNGYDIIDRAMLKPEEITFANVWGVCDEDLFNRTMKENDKAFADGKPFFDMVMTTSNHRPFTYPDGKIDLPSKSGRLGGVKYTDYAIHRFLEEAKTKPWFANTIFVVVADHTAGAAGKTEIDPHGYHIPLFIYAPGLVKPQSIDTLASQIDLAPTLLGLLDLHYDTRFYGADLRKETPSRALVSNYQALGLLTPEEMVVLKPVRQVDHFVKQGDDYVATKQPVPASLLQRALAYYQTATRWREWSHDLDEASTFSK